MWIGRDNELTVQLQYQPEYTVCSRMLRTKVELHVLYGRFRRGWQRDVGQIDRRYPVDLLVGVQYGFLELFRKLPVRIPLVRIATLTARERTYVILGIESEAVGEEVRL